MDEKNETQDAENLQLNLTKCEFFRQTIEFLGYTITAGTTTPLIRNTDVIHAIPPPNNRKTLQSFLGAVNVYNKFIPDYARLRTPLNNLLKKDVTWDWDDKCQKAFTSLKESLTQHPVLHLYKDELPCQVYCDASTLGIAGVLKQVHSAGKAYPVQYFSRALRVHERNYTISELECLAIVESVEKFRVYLMGRKFTIFSDHHALQWLKTIKNPSGRLFRWSLRLSCYEYEVRYIKGSLQHEADLLSRNPFCGFLDATIIKNHQLTPSGESKLTIDRNGLQTLKRRGVTKIVVPDALVPDLLTMVHSRYNHPGISQMTRLISPQYYWKGMSEDISKTTKACAICQSTKPPRGPTFGELGQLPVATQPFDLVALDTIAGLAKYGNAKAYLHVVVDHFSRYTWTFPSKSTSLTTYQQVIKRVLQDGSPKRLLTDRAPAFTSPKFRKFLINRNIHPLLTTSNNPQANGLCERLNATLTGKLRLLHLENPKAAWTKLAKRVTVVYNNTPHSVTGFPPGYLMFGVLPPELTEHVNPYPVLTTARRIAHERTQAKHLKDKHAYDQQHKTPHFEPGDLVLVKVYHHPNTGKLAPYFTGPYEILEIISPNVLVEVYGEKCMDIKNVRKWCREFNEGRMIHDEQRSGRPSLPESTVARIDEMVRANRPITLEEIEDGLNEDCSHFSVHKIVSETLGYRKVSARNQCIFEGKAESVDLHPEVMKLTNVAKATIYKYHLGLEVGNASHLIDLPTLWERTLAVHRWRSLSRGDFSNRVFCSDVERHLVAVSASALLDHHCINSVSC
ncbi:hypothetical protein LAZ67_23001300 [Cordylochernes scorpioides]|uniref:RNA-directed DNA polymerase n=1 Tax=Cordylochernes scorpioides TaxID=51811 RepID=A0ABY6LQK8_9ARAC|nr:hypothetical protein LAZ67_23001300 [Cordylochernes scorpioides]